MRLTSFVVGIVLIGTACGDDKPAKPLTPGEAAKKVNEKVTVEMEVKSTGGGSVWFLNSEADFKDEKNFTLFVPATTVEMFKKSKIEDHTHFKGKTVQVTGTVTLYREKPQIKIEEPDQIKIIEKK